MLLAWLLAQGGYPNADAVLAALTTTSAWDPPQRKRVSRTTVENLPWWMRIIGTLIGATADVNAHCQDSLCGIARQELLGQRSLTEVAATALLGRQPGVDHCSLSRR